MNERDYSEYAANAKRIIGRIKDFVPDTAIVRRGIMKLGNLNMKAKTAGILIIMIALFIGACGRKPLVDSKQISQDVKENIEVINEYELTVDSVKIEKRRTQSENGTDDIWFNVSASNDHCEYTAYCEGFYSRYDNGWFMEGIKIIDSELTPKVSATDFPQSTADSEIEEMGYTNYKMKDRTDYDESISFTYNAYKDGEEMIVSLNYEFTPQRGWYLFTSAGFPADSGWW